MSDLVERLENMAMGLPEQAPIYKEAAAEIKRLRRHNAAADVMERIAAANCADPATEDLSVQLAIELAQQNEHFKKMEAIGHETEAALNDCRLQLVKRTEMLKAAREEIVYGMAFLNRDAQTGRLDITANQLSQRFAKADANIRAALTSAKGDHE